MGWRTGNARYPMLAKADQEVADVWSYIKTFPEPPSAKSIPILNQ